MSVTFFIKVRSCPPFVHGEASQRSAVRQRRRWRDCRGRAVSTPASDPGVSMFQTVYAHGRSSCCPHAQEVENVLVIVTRYFGGIHLGPDRFKHINQAARNALELGGFLDVPEDTHSGRRQGKGRGGAVKR